MTELVEAQERLQAHLTGDSLPTILFKRIKPALADALEVPLHSFLKQIATFSPLELRALAKELSTLSSRLTDGADETDAAATNAKAAALATASGSVSESRLALASKTPPTPSDETLQKQALLCLRKLAAAPPPAAPQSALPGPPAPGKRGGAIGPGGHTPHTPRMLSKVAGIKSGWRATAWHTWDDAQALGSWSHVTFEAGAVVRVELAAQSLRGTLPSHVFRPLRWLRVINLSANALAGPIPLSIARCEDLRVLDIARNELSGHVPPELGTLVALVRLELQQNKLEGAIPASFSQLSNLERLWLFRNHLVGTIPAGLALGCTALKRLELRWNSITGSLPSELGALHRLEVLDLGENAISSVIPPSVGRLTALTSLRLESNRLSGKLPAALGACCALRELVLRDNHLEGRVPTAFSSLSNLRELDVAANRLTGVVPKALTTLTTLERLFLVSEGTHAQSQTSRGGIGSSPSADARPLVLNRNDLTGADRIQIALERNGGNLRQWRI